MDVNGDGQLTIDELRTALKEIKEIRIPEKELLQVI